MAFKLLSGASAVGASRAVRIARNITDHTLDIRFRSLAATKISAVVVKLQGASTDGQAETGVISDPAIAIGSTAERVANGKFDYRINNKNYTKAAVAAGSVFSAAHVVSASKWGVILLYVDVSGNIISRVPVATQAYASAAAAHTAADAVETFAAHCYIGRILINADAGGWTANTDDLTDGSDLTTATFISETPEFYDLGTKTFSADEITAQKAMVHVTNKNVRFVRAYLSTLTGTGEVDVLYTPAVRPLG